MRHISALAVLSILALALAGCTSSDVAAGGGGPGSTPSPHETSAASEPTGAVVQSGSSDPEAQAQAHAWLDAAALPPGAVPADASVARFGSFTGWPCGPVAELEAFWSVPDSTVGEIANWLSENPPADLISTAGGPISDDAALQSAIVGYVPGEGAQEGIVYTVEKTQDGVAVRAEVAAQTADAACPDLPDGEGYGAPGQG